MTAPATLDGIPGEGYAEIEAGRGGMKRCEGVFYSGSREADSKLFSVDSPYSTFTGTVYEGKEKHQLSFEVVVTDLETGTARHAVVHFKARGNPFQS